MIQTWSSFSLMDPCSIFFCSSVKPKFFTPTHVLSLTGLKSCLLWQHFIGWNHNCFRAAVPSPLWLAVASSCLTHSLTISMQTKTVRKSFHCCTENVISDTPQEFVSSGQLWKPCRRNVLSCTTQILKQWDRVGNAENTQETWKH